MRCTFAKANGNQYRRTVDGPLGPSAEVQSNGDVYWDIDDHLLMLEMNDTF